MFGHSLPITMMGLNITRRVAFTASRCLGKSPREAVEIAEDIGISAGAVLATTVAIATIDLAGGAASAAYLALESGEAEKRRQGK